MKRFNLLAPQVLTPLPDDLTVCTTIDDSTGHEQIITDLMIRRACEQMDADQLWPFRSNAVYKSRKPVPVGGATIIPFPHKRTSVSMK